MEFKCPQCKVNPIKRRKPIGSLPRCQDCLLKNRQGRNKRSIIARKQGKRLSHHDKNGVRYDTKNRKVICDYCGVLYLANKLNRKGYYYCKNCVEEHKEYIRQNKLLCSFRAKLRKMNLSIDWYNKQDKKCSICYKPQGRNRLSIDHDHNCCEKCVRGLLCHKCNAVLGLANDNCTILKSAISYLESHPLLPSPILDRL